MGIGPIYMFVPSMEFPLHQLYNPRVLFGSPYLPFHKKIDFVSIRRVIIHYKHLLLIIDYAFISEISFYSFLHAHWCSEGALSSPWRRRCSSGWRIVRLVRYIRLYGTASRPPSSDRYVSISLKIDWILNGPTREIEMEDPMRDLSIKRIHG